MIDSTNPRQLADNIRKLWDKFKSISGDLLPSRSTATTGQILKLTGETKTPAWVDEYTPPAYSETETATGQKWIDGKNIYSIVISDTIPTLSSAGPVNIPVEAETVIHYRFFVNETDVDTLLNNAAYYYRTTNRLSITSIQPAYSNKNYICIVLYTKPDPVPGRAPEDENERIEKLYSYDENEKPEDFVAAEVPEPEEKKTTKKKTK